MTPDTLKLSHKFNVEDNKEVKNILRVYAQFLVGGDDNKWRDGDQWCIRTSFGVDVRAGALVVELSAVICRVMRISPCARALSWAVATPCVRVALVAGLADALYSVVVDKTVSICSARLRIALNNLLAVGSCRICGAVTSKL
jgi:hypothetical protein